MNTYLSLPIVQSIFALALMVIVLKGHFRSFMHRLFSLYLFCLAIWGVIIFGMRASQDLEQAYNWEKWIVLLAPFMTVVFYHFTVRFTGIIVNRWILPAMYAVSFLFATISRTDLVISGIQVKPYGHAAISGPLFPIFGLFSFAVFILALRSLWKLFRYSSFAEERNRSAYIIIGLSFSLVGGVFDIFPMFGLPLYPGAIIGNLVFCLFTTVAIVKYNLLDINFFIRKSTAYLLTSAAIAVPVIGLFFLATYLLSEFPLAPWLYLFIIIVLAFTVPGLWRLVQKQVDRWFYRDRYGYLKALETFNWHTQSLFDITSVGDTTVKMVAGALGASNVCLLQPLSQSGDFQIVCSANKMDDASQLVLEAQSPLLRWLRHSGGLLRRHDILGIPQLQSVAWEESELLQRIGAELIAPLRSRGGQLSGLLLVGSKKTREPYSMEEMQIVATVSNQIAITLENTRLYHDILESRENLETWLNSMSDCVIIVDDNQTIQFMNRAAITSFDGSADKKCWQALGREGKCHDCPLPDGNGKSSPKHVGSRAIGTREYEVATAPLRNPDGSMSFIEVFRDVTERKRLEEEIIQAKVKIETLAQSERLKTDLLSMVSHELRTPLSVIKSHITTFLRHNNKWEDGEKLDFLRDIDQETDDLARLVGNLLDMSSLEAGAMKLQKDYYQISEILEWAGKKLKTLTQDHVMSVRIKPELQDVFVDRTRIGQVIINLCENAAKYSHRGSRILIEAACLDNTVVVSVVDEGEGIASQYLDKVFDRFYRVGKNNHSESGIGLGLAICRGIIEAHGGKIWAESTEGKGSKFSFSLPVKGKESEPDDTQPVIR